MGVRLQRNIVTYFLLGTAAYVTVRILFTAFFLQGPLDEIKDESMDFFEPAPRYDYSKDIAPFHEFDPEQAKMVIILTYQRCGSSFFGNLFNTNPDVFYLYEPLDSLYTALYGTAEGWNVPSDIFSLWNGTERRLPAKEIKAVSVFLRQLLSCNLNALPTETIIHKYWYMFAGDHQLLRPYIKCIRQNNISYTKCDEFTPGYCGKRFGQATTKRLDECNRYLWNVKFRDSSTHPIRRNFTGYKACLTKMRNTVEENCIELFSDSCESKMLRSAKLVRGTMDSMGLMLRDNPNLRVIHLFRDPRGAILSRKEFDSSARGHYSQGPDLMAREAKLYCRSVVRDVRIRKELEEQYPGKIYPILYDDFVKDPAAYTANIYRFLNTTIHKKTMNWLLDNTSKKKNSSVIAGRWQDTLTFKKYNDIMANCKEFFSVIKYDWPLAS